MCLTPFSALLAKWLKWCGQKSDTSVRDEHEDCNGNDEQIDLFFPVYNWKWAQLVPYKTKEGAWFIKETMEGDGQQT